MTTRRLFFALWPNDRQRDALRDVIGSVAKTVEGQAVERRNWHVTLAFVGDFPADRVDELKAAAAELPLSPFRLSFDRMEFWARPGIACLVPATVPAELDALASGLAGLLAGFGVAGDEHGYRPHITVVRRARRFPTERLGGRFALDWDEFRLIESVPAPGGSRYRPI